MDYVPTYGKIHPIPCGRRRPTLPPTNFKSLHNFVIELYVYVSIMHLDSDECKMQRKHKSLENQKYAQDPKKAEY